MRAFVHRTLTISAVLAFVFALSGIILPLFASSAWADEGADDAPANTQKALVLPTEHELFGAPSPVQSTLYNAASTVRKQEFSYNGGVQTFTAPWAGDYDLYVHGASGGVIKVRVVSGGHMGAASGNGENRLLGVGGRTYGNVTLSKGGKLYVACGGRGTDLTYQGNSTSDQPGTSGGWNGGGNGGAGKYNPYTSKPYWAGTGGGGASHVSTSSHGQLVNFSDKKNQLVAVAGGGGGEGLVGGGVGGGIWGGTGAEIAHDDGTEHRNIPQAGGPNSGYAFGKGQNGRDGCLEAWWGWDGIAEGHGGGGGGLYGGYASQDDASYGGGGGSGYVGSKLKNGVTEQGNGAGAFQDGFVQFFWDAGYNVIYKKNGGEGSMSSSRFAIDDDSTKLPKAKFTRTGYDPVGWSPDKNCDWEHPTYEFGQSTKAINPGKLQADDIILYCVWQPKSVEVGFWRNQSPTDSKVSNVKFYYDVPGQTFDDQGFTKKGYEITGWSFERQESKNTPPQVGNNALDYDYVIDWDGVTNEWILEHENDDFTLYAVWMPKRYTLKIHHNTAGDGGAGAAPWDGQTYYEREVIYDSTFFNALTREATAEIEMNPDRKFLGYWSLSSGGAQVYSDYGLALSKDDWFKDGTWHRDNEPTIDLWAHWG